MTRGYARTAFGLAPAADCDRLGSMMLRLLPRRRFLIAVALACLCAAAPFARAAEAPAPLPDGLYAEIGTPRGTLVAELHFEKTPLTVASFVGLAEGTLGPAPRKPFYNGLKFHRVVADFVAQGGDPLGTGAGGPGYEFADEFAPGLHHSAAGTLSMANGGPDDNGSQFFLTLRELPRLNYLHAVFGRVVRGTNLLRRIQQGDTMTVKIVRVGAAAQAFRADDGTFAELAAKAKKYDTVTFAKPEPGPLAHFDDPNKLLPSDTPRAKYFNYKLANFERATGVRIAARMFAKSPPAAEDDQPGKFMKALAAKLGIEQRGAVAAYFADEREWRIWVVGESTAPFFGRPPTEADLGEGAAFHDVKEAFIKAAEKAGDTAYMEQVQATPQGRTPPGQQQRLKLRTDAILDGLILKLEPK